MVSYLLPLRSYKRWIVCSYRTKRVYSEFEYRKHKYRAGWKSLAHGKKNVRPSRIQNYICLQLKMSNVIQSNNVWNSKKWNFTMVKRTTGNATRTLIVIKDGVHNQIHFFHLFRVISNFHLKWKSWKQWLDCDFAYSVWFFTICREIWLVKTAVGIGWPTSLLGYSKRPLSVVLGEYCAIYMQGTMRNNRIKRKFCTKNLTWFFEIFGKHPQNPGYSEINKYFDGFSKVCYFTLYPGRTMLNNSIQIRLIAQSI